MSMVTHGVTHRALIAAFITTTILHADSKKLAEDQRVELLRGLDAEHATARAYIPRSKKPLDFESATGDWDKKLWEEIGRQLGPAARAGDLIQVTKVKIEKDAIILELNSGAKGRWYDGVQARQRQYHPAGQQHAERSAQRHFDRGALLWRDRQCHFRGSEENARAVVRFQ